MSFTDTFHNHFLNITYYVLSKPQSNLNTTTSQTYQESGRNIGMTINTAVM